MRTCPPPATPRTDLRESNRVLCRAAHTLPPARGGYGANTGIEDSFNLAWKLASVVTGKSSRALLDTYDAERRPIAWLRHDQIFARQDYARWATDEEKAVPVIADDAMELGQLYRSSAVLGAGAELPPALPPDEWAGQPGTRAPHLWITEGETQRSTLDLLQRSWTLLTEDERWCTAAARASEETGIDLTCLHIGEAHRTPLADFQLAFGIGPSGASLVRPDGYVAWRARGLPADPAASLAEAVRKVAARPRR